MDSTVSGKASHSDRLQLLSSSSATKPPTIIRSPWAKLTVSVAL
jgi:hypothetical protein